MFDSVGCVLIFFLFDGIVVTIRKYSVCNDLDVKETHSKRDVRCWNERTIKKMNGDARNHERACVEQSVTRKNVQQQKTKIQTNVLLKQLKHAIYVNVVCLNRILAEMM